jgi:AraC-like DNA-binding protein
MTDLAEPPTASAAAPPRRVAMPSPPMRMEVIRAMRADPAREFKTAGAAARMGVPPEVFIRAFKQLTGLSPQRFHSALRIERAKQLLVETERAVTDVSLDVGYDSLGTFVRTFSLLVGVAPSQLRKLSRGENPVALARDGLPSWRRRRQGTPARTVPVRLDPASAGRGRVVAVGLFPQSIPAGLPLDGCFIDPESGTGALRLPDGHRRASLLAAGFEPFAPDTGWLGRFDDLVVCRMPVPPAGSGAAALSLRPLAESDPPFLTAIPLLFLLDGGD